MSCHSHTLSLSHTHYVYITFPHPHIRSVTYLQESLYPHLSQGLTYSWNLHLSTSSRNPGCHLHFHTKTAHHLFPISHTHTSVIVLPTYILSVIHVIYVTHSLWPPPTVNTHFFLCSGGSNRVASPKSPIFSSMFSVIKKFPRREGAERCVRVFSLCLPTPTPILLAQESHPA